ncbi:hypothetical protein EXS74_04055 [Candidatus Woesearchaeota archaeon]|nr:hypothetical protein [Candidatus Woesearchaeota archaeon]
MGLYKKSIEKSNVASSVQEKPLTQKKEESPPKKIDATKPVTSFRTDIDKFYHILELSADPVLHTKVLEILDVSSSQVEDWAKLLEKQGILDIDYTTTGGVLYNLKGALPQQKKEILSENIFFPQGKKRVIFLVLLLLIAVVLVYYFFSASILSFFSALFSGGGA